MKISKGTPDPVIGRPSSAFGKKYSCAYWVIAQMKEHDQKNA